MIQGGAALNDINSFIQLDSQPADLGTNIPLERDLGLRKSQLSANFLVSARISNRWMIEGQYFEVNRRGSQQISRDITFADHKFDLGGNVSGEIGLSSYRLAVGYSLFKTANTEVGAAFSIYVSDLSASLSGDAHINGIHAGFSTRRYSAPARLPAIGIYGHYALSPRWLISARLDYIDLGLSTAKWFRSDLEYVGGSILSFELSTEYRLLEHVGVGLSYRRGDVDFWAKSPGLNGRVGYTFAAPTAFVRVSF